MIEERSHHPFSYSQIMNVGRYRPYWSREYLFLLLIFFKMFLKLFFKKYQINIFKARLCSQTKPIRVGLFL
jgi:hypothetical protein